MWRISSRSRLVRAPLEYFFETAGANPFGEQLKSVKIIKDRDDRPKGFGYVEFETLQGLKDGLAKTGAVSISDQVVDPP